MKNHYTIDFDAVWKEQGLIASRAYGGFFFTHPDKSGVLYFDSETGEVRQVSAEEEEALTI